MEITGIERIKLGDRVIAQSDKTHTILHDVNSITTVKITTESYQIIKDLCDRRISLYKAFEMCESEDDRNYLTDVLEYLLQNKIVRSDVDESEYETMGMRIDLDITNRCNLRCKHCCVDAGKKNDDLSTDEMMDVIKKVISVNPEGIVVSGGEPLIRPDFTKLIKEIRSTYSGKLDLMTNAILVTKDNADFIKENFDSISVSIDGYDEATCSIVRGAGAFLKIIDGIRLLKNAGVESLSASMVLDKYTYNKKNKFSELCKELGVTPVMRVLSMTGRAEKEMGEYAIPSLEDEEYECEKLEERIDSKDVIRMCKLFSCGAGYRQFQVDYKGNIYPCQSLMKDELCLGNVLEIDDLNEYLRKRKFITTKGYRELEKYFPYNFSGCSGCNKQLMCWNCIETIYRSRERNSDCDRCSEVFDKFFA